MNENILEQIVKESISKVESDHDLKLVEKEVCAGKADEFPSKIKLLKKYRELLKKNKIVRNKKLEDVLIKKQVRTISGVAPVAIFTKPDQCPGNCHFCPTQENVPKSYLNNEPAVMRAERNNYQPIEQVWDRLQSLYTEGHPIDKIELIIMGGSFSNYSDDYKEEFIKKVYWAANNFRPGISKSKSKEYSSKLKLFELQKGNEAGKYRIIGLSVETRPDLIGEKEIALWRRLGVTRVEIGVQVINDKILKKNNRGHGLEEVVNSTQLLKDNGFKVIYHLMPGLPGSNKKTDLDSFEKVFSNQDYKPDQIKIYPCVVTKGSKIYQWYQKGKFKPYQGEELVSLIKKVKSIIPRWIRIIRIIRDIPSQSVVGGNRINNLRQIIIDQMEKEGKSCNCIRCQEIGSGSKSEKIKLFIKRYKASKGEEIFFSYENLDRSNLYGILRLRIPSQKNNLSKFKVLKKAGLIRELHVYGPALRIKKRNKTKPQHQGIGRKLMEEAEKFVQNKTNLNKIAVISGIGVRSYYEKLGYSLEGSYMVKTIDS